LEESKPVAPIEIVTGAKQIEGYYGQLISGSLSLIDRKAAFAWHDCQAEGLRLVTGRILCRDCV
jgi:hypothetical protein